VLLPLLLCHLLRRVRVVVPLLLLLQGALEALRFGQKIKFVSYQLSFVFVCCLSIHIFGRLPEK
jgi:hypothetical protein